MPRPEKVQAVAEIKERMEGARAVFLAEYAGLSVKEQQELRRELRAKGAEFKVVKMSLARRAADDLSIDTLDDLLLGPTGLTFADDDPVSAAKVLKDFARDHDVFMVKGGLLGVEFLSPEKISDLADIEPRDVLLAKLAGAMQAPMANLAGLLAALPRNTASVLQQLLDKKGAAEPVSEQVGEPAASATDDASAGDVDGEPDEADRSEATPDGDADAEAPAGAADEAETDAADEAETGESETDAADAADEAETGESETDEADEADDSENDDTPSADAGTEEK